MLISFEGIDKSGKTTQANLLQKKLESLGYKTLFIREPGGTFISEKIRDILLDSKNHEMDFKAEFLLYSASRAQLVEKVIKPALRESTIVICDRYYDSSTAYQGFGRGIDLSIIEFINNFAAGIKPDITFFIDIELNESKNRLIKQGGIKDRLESSGDLFFNKVREGFHYIAGKEPGRMKIIDGTLPEKDIEEILWTHIKNKINDKNIKEV
jgi:dTMP kinase